MCSSDLLRAARSEVQDLHGLTNRQAMELKALRKALSQQRRSEKMLKLEMRKQAEQHKLSRGHEPWHGQMQALCLSMGGEAHLEHLAAPGPAPSWPRSATVRLPCMSNEYVQNTTPRFVMSLRSPFGIGPLPFGYTSSRGVARPRSRRSRSASNLRSPLTDIHSALDPPPRACE